MKQCKKCGELKPLSEFSPHKQCKDGVRGTCKKCASLFSSAWARRRESSLEGHMLQVLNEKRHYARQNNMPFDLDLSFLVELYRKQNGICAVSGLPFSDDSILYIKNSPFKPSLDRIDSRRGYEKDNVHFVLYAVNLAKNEWDLDTIVPVWKAVAKNWKAPPDRPSLTV
jgi:hypothetical protein